MACIDGNLLNSLLSAVNKPKSTLDALQEYRDNLYKKMEQANDEKENTNNSAPIDSKQIIVEIKSVGERINQAQYEETARKLEEEQLKLEEITARNWRQRDRARKKHESMLLSASMGKLLSANEKLAQYQTMAHNNSAATDLYSDNSEHSLLHKAEEINRDINESASLSMEAAEIARKRTTDQIQNEDGSSLAKNKKKKKAVDIMI